MVNIMRLCDIVDIKSAFMEKTDLSEEEIQTIIDDIPTAFDGDKVIEQLEEKIVIAKILELVIIVNAIGVQEH